MLSFTGSCHWVQDGWEVWVCCWHRKESCLWIKIGGEEKYCPRRWCFCLFQWPHSTSYNPSNQVLLNSVRRMSFWTVVICRHWFLVTAMQRWMRKYSTQFSLMCTSRNSADLLPVRYIPGWIPHMPSFSSTLPGKSRE